MSEKKRVLLSYVRMDKHDDQFWDYTGLFYLAGALERRGYAPFVYHGPWMGLQAAVDEKGPDVLGFTCDAENQCFLQALIPSILQAYREKTGGSPYILAGGPQAGALGEDFLKASGTDFVLRGEGEEILPDLLDILFSGRKETEKDLHRIPGLAWTDAAGVFRETPGFGMVADLDTLPRPAYHCSLHQKIYGRVIFTGRGCPFHCAFCATNAGFKKLRLRKIPDVLAEIQENLDREKEIRYLVIQDDTFCANASRVREFCAGMRRIREKRPVVWFCETHVRTLLHDPGLLKEMVDSGLVRMQIGMESGDSRVLELYNKHITPEEILELVTMAVEAELPQIVGNFIIGGPKEEKGATESFIRTLLQAGPGVVDISTSFLRNYPSTAIFDNPGSFGLKVVSEDNLTAGNDYPSVIPMDAEEEEIVELRQSINLALRQDMGRAIEERKIPHSQVMKQFQLLEEYGISSRWIAEYKTREHVFEYYRTMYLGEAVPFDPSAPPEALYPQRTMEFYRCVIKTGGIAKAFGTVLSPLEYDLMFYSGGKLSVSQIADALWEKYRDAYENRESFVQFLMRLTENCERRFWLTVFRFP